MAGLVGGGCLLAATPLLFALWLAGQSLERIIDSTEALIDEGVTVAQLAGDLDSQLDDVERSVRQYLVLRDPQLYQLAERRWDSALATAQSLAAQPLGIELAAQVTQVRRQLLDTRRTWEADVGTEEAANGDRSGEQLHAVATELHDIIVLMRERTILRLDQLRGTTLHARREMMMSAITLIPLAALLAFACTLAVTRPLRKIYRTIAALGHGRAVPAVTIGFPREMHRLGEQLEWLRRRLAQLEADKDRFLRQVSHELKTPLASLREGTEMLCEGALGGLTPRQSEVAGILSEATAELDSLISNLLAYAQWHDGLRQARCVDFAPRPLLDEVLAMHALAMAKRELFIDVDTADDIPLHGQRSQIRVALDNLLTNALKHAPSGSVIEIRTARDQVHCRISVRDYGRGIAEAEKQNIFEPFVRGGEAEEQGIRGTGVGLSIVKEVAEAHGGTITIEDAQPGARFHLLWPVPCD
ncbi:MAG: sensor histidine kinase [Hydrocarboniphaga sp.]|nr:sensor histidine kinase [Hydrocarboniphaga sp.]